MDERRMNVLYKQVQNMNSTLVDMLDNYKKYTESSFPVVTVLCSENKLRNDMEMLFGSRSDIIAKVYSTFDEQAKDNEFNALLSDAAVICTRAKTISPAGLYNSAKSICKVNKPVWILIFGWESLPKTPEKLKQRIEHTKDKFSFLKIENVTNVFSNPLLDMVTSEEAVQSLCMYFAKNCEKLRADQEEALYRYVKGYVSDYYTVSRDKINKVIEVLNDLERKVMSKQDYFNTKFSNLAVRFQEIADGITTAIGDISFYDIPKNSDGQTLSEIYKTSGSQAQLYAKKFTADEMQQRIRRFYEENENLVEISAELLVEECRNAMLSFCNDISKLNYISKEDVLLLRNACQNDGGLSNIPSRYGKLMNEFIEDIIYRVPANVNKFEYGMNTSVKLRDLGLKTVDYAKKLLTDNEDADNDKAALPSAKQEKTEDAMMLSNFRDDVEGMIIHSKIAVSNTVQERLRNIREKINRVCTDILNKYFEGIYNGFETINAHTQIMLSDFNMG